MNPIRHIRRFVAVLAGLAAASVALTATPAFARVVPPAVGGSGTLAPAPIVAPVRTVTRTIVVSGMPGWQIALIAVGTALLAAALAVLADRAWTTRKIVTAA